MQLITSQIDSGGNMVTTDEKRGLSADERDIEEGK